MLPTVQLRKVKRRDVERIDGWLRDNEVSSRWFGHYAYGDPVHRGYEPGLMLTASSEDWARVFELDRGRCIFSIYAAGEGHIGESQAVFDGSGDVELSLLIGRKDLWNRGFGAAAAMQLLDRVFTDYPVDQAWVSIPENNVAALRLFGRLGFTHVGDRVMAATTDRRTLRATILALSVHDYQDRRIGGRGGATTASPIITVTGLPGSGSEHVGAETARLLRATFCDDEIGKELCLTLDRTEGEVLSLETSYSSIWARMLSAALAPWERYGALESPTDFVGAIPLNDYPEPYDYLSKEEYVAGLKSTISSLVAAGTTILHGNGAPGLVPAGRPTFHVFVDTPLDRRIKKAEMEEMLRPEVARRLLKKADREFIAIHKGLFDTDPLDTRQYDIVINMDRLSVESAARIVSGAVVRSASSHRRMTGNLQTA